MKKNILVSLVLTIGLAVGLTPSLSTSAATINSNTNNTKVQSVSRVSGRWGTVRAGTQLFTEPRPGYGAGRLSSDARVRVYSDSDEMSGQTTWYYIYYAGEYYYVAKSAVSF